MKTFFVMLCVFVVINGILRSFIDDAKFARYFGLLSGILILCMVISGLKQMDLSAQLEQIQQEYTDEGIYEKSILEESEARLSALAEEKIQQKLGISCEVKVSLRYEEDAVKIVSVEVSGVEKNADIVYLLSQLFETEGGMIYFNG